MNSMPIIVLEDIDVEELVGLAIDMPDTVPVGDIDIDIELVELVIEISVANCCAKSRTEIRILLAQDVVEDIGCRKNVV